MRTWEAGQVHSNRDGGHTCGELQARATSQERNNILKPQAKQTLGPDSAHSQVTSLSPRPKEIKGQVLTINLQNRMRCDWAVTVGQGGEACSGQVIPRAFLGQGLYTRTAGQTPRRHGARRDVCCEKKQCWLKTAKELRRTVGSSADHVGSSEGEGGASTCLMPGTVSAEGGGPGLQATCVPGPHSHLDWCSWTRVQQTEQTLVEFLRS